VPYPYSLECLFILIPHSVPKLRYHVQEPGKRYPNGEEPPSETKKPRVMRTLGLDEDGFAEARKQFKNICQDLEISGKTGTNMSKWDQAKNTLVARNTTIRDVLFFEGAAEEADDRRGVLDAFCRYAAPGPKRVSTGSAQGQGGERAEMRVKVEGAMMEVKGAMMNESIGEMMTKEEEVEESMEVGEMTRQNGVREATADAANTLEILRMIAAQDFIMHE